jgi:hypothetical protein
MRRSSIKIAVAAALLLLGALSIVLGRGRFAFFHPRARGPIPQDAYVWQRVWTPEVLAAVGEADADFTRLLVLGGEVSFEDGKTHVVPVGIDRGALRRAARPVGLAFRVGPYAGPFEAAGEPYETIASLVRVRLGDARRAGLPIAEVQIDFDCPTSKLDGYRVWVDALRREVGPIPLTITALPAWLGAPAFERLIDATDGYVLQVHALERPSRADAPLVLCDPEAAMRAAERAARLGRPFRVSLPTYGYLVAFDAEGKFLGLSADGPQVSWPGGARVRQLWADPAAMAELVTRWTADRPAALVGLVWYRLPVATDAMNWRAQTLAAVRAGKRPAAELHAEIGAPEPLLHEITLVNAGDADAPPGLIVSVRTPDTERVAADALGGFEVVDGGEHRLDLRASEGAPRVRAGERRVIGWVRLQSEGKVEAHVATAN